MVAEAATGGFRTAQVVRDWIEEQFGVVNTRDRMYALLSRLGIRFKVPRPRPAKTAPRVQETWKKGGLGQHLAEAGLRAWQADPAWVRQLCVWGWIRETLTALSTDTRVIQS